MFLTLLLQTWPTLHPVLMLFIGAVVSAILTFLAASYWRKHDAAKAERAAELAAAAKAATEQQEWDDWQGWRKRVDEQVAKFMPEDDIKSEVSKLGKDIGENQGKLKLLHDRAEEVSNALNMRVAALEQHSANLASLPQQVQRLNTDHAVLASEVRALASNIDKLSEKQEKHFSDLMQAVQRLAFTRAS